MDEALRQYLKCDIEFEIEGLSESANNARAAKALRLLADQIERGEFDDTEDGFTEVSDGAGTLGTIYLDRSEGT